jgi:cutinase
MGSKKISVTLLAAVAGAGLAAVVVPGTAASAADCSDVQVVFARGTGEAPGLGILGRPLAAGVAAALPGRSVTAYAVTYPADFAQAGDGQGATDLTQHVVSTAAACPGTQFVLGGYSQGAGVVDIALGVGGALGRGTVLPASVAPKIAAVTVFGNPKRIGGGAPLDRSDTPVRDRSLDQCATGDPVCGGGNTFAAHLAYARDGSVDRAVRFAADRLSGGGATGGGTATSAPAAPAPTAPVRGRFGGLLTGQFTGQFGGFDLAGLAEALRFSRTR